MSVASREVPPSPAPERLEHGLEGAAVAGHAIPDAKIRRRERPSDHEAVALHLSELLAQHFGGDVRHRTSKLAKAMRAR